jgi:hypothetical protein
MNQNIIDPDTIIVPARHQGFFDVFMSEHRWWALRLSPISRARLKYIAAYRVAPVCAVTHIAKIRDIKPWHDTGRYVIEFTGPPEELPSPIPFKKGEHRTVTMQTPRLTTHERLMSAKTIDDLWW